VPSVTTLRIRVNLSIASVASVCPSKIVWVAGAQYHIDVVLVVNVYGVDHFSALRGTGMLILPENGVQLVNSICCQYSLPCNALQSPV